LPSNGSRQRLDSALVPGRQIDPRIQPQEPERRIRTGEQYRNDREVRFAHLSVEREISLRVLPRAEAFSPEKDRHGAARRERPLERLRPGLSGSEVSAIKKYADLALMQRPGHPGHRRMVDPVIAEEDVEGALHLPAPEQSRLLYRI
jgi:hypothetical protein